MSGKSLIVYTEFGTDIGFGHYMRCKSIADVAVEKGIAVKFLVYTPDDAYPFPEERFEVRNANWHQNASLIASEVSPEDVVLVDSYLATEESYQLILGQTERVVAIDDYMRIDYGQCTIFNPNCYYHTLPYSNKSFGGAEYALLREQFRNTTNGLNVKDQVEQVMLIFGGSDIRDLFPTLLPHLSADNPDIQFVAVSGNDQYGQELEALFADHKNVSIKGRLSAEELIPLMLDSDVAITACGQTLGELSYLGIPLIGICIDVDQVPFRDFYSSEGLMSEALNWDQEDLKERIQHNLKALSTVEERSKRSEKLKSVVDGQGARRALEKLMEL